MTIPRIFHSDTIVPGQELSLSKEACHHLLHVLRIKQQAEITLFNGQGGEYSATIQAIQKKSIQVKVNACLDKESESPLKIHLGQGISRGEKMDFTIQKAVELGVTHITPIFTERAGVHLSHERLEKRQQHWQSVIISACEQCGRNQLPQLGSTSSLEQWLSQLNTTTRFLLNPHTGQSLKTFGQKPMDIALLIGPEGGLSPAEIEKAHEFRFSSICLGPRILRTETAALATLSALQMLWGDF